jgi:hypothetical protein
VKKIAKEMGRGGGGGGVSMHEVRRGMLEIEIKKNLH